MNMLSRKRSFLEAVGISLLAWAILGVCLLIWPPQYAPWNIPDLPLFNADRTPHPITLKTPIDRFFALIYVAEIIYIKAFMMWRRTIRPSSFSWSLIALNVAFAYAYEMAVAFAIWLTLAKHHDLRLINTGLVALVATWALIELFASDEPAPERGSPWTLVDELVIERDDLRTQNQTLLDIVKARHGAVT